MKLVIPIVVILLLAGGGFAATRFLGKSATLSSPAIKANARTSFAEAETPKVSTNAYVHPQAVVIGHVGIADDVFVGPFVSIRGDEGVPIEIAEKSNVQDGVVIHGRVTQRKGETIDANVVTVKHEEYSVYIGKEVSLEHQCLIHGPVSIGENTLIGMQAVVADAHVGKRCIIGTRALVQGVEIHDGRLVAPGLVVIKQEVADSLPRASADDRKVAEETVERYVEMAGACRTEGKSEKGEGKGEGKSEKGETKKSH